MQKSDLDPDPIRQFGSWYADLGERPDDTVCLATATSDGRPSARMVLLRGFDERGFCFYTNLSSRKARELEENPRAALVFHWPEGRQVRVEGDVERVAADEADAYWRSRPRGSQLGAWASDQSAVIADRGVLDDALADVTERFEAGDVPRPEDWGGFRIAPTSIEFWVHRDDRLHDRLRYRRDGEGWQLERLAP